MTWWRTPVEDPGRRAGPKVPDEERKGIQAGTVGHGGTALVDLFGNVPDFYRCDSLLGSHIGYEPDNICQIRT